MRYGAFALMLVWSLTAQARPAPNLIIESPVDGAVVEIDGKVVGKTPLRGQSLVPGTHTVRVKKLGYLEYSESVRVTAGKPLSVFADLLPFAGVIVVRGTPKNAQVFVDERAVGTLPLEYEVKTGKHSVRVSAKGYTSISREISADPGQTYALEFKLPRGEGDDLALEPLAPQPAADDLALEPLTEPPLLAPKRPIDVSTSVEPASRWYQRYWVWGAAAAAVVGGVVLGVVMRDDDEASSEPKPDRTWTLR
jgi:hypothetical protein